MDFLQLAETRYSVRSFRSEKIPRETLERILKAGHLAPTACNLQPQRILVLDGEAQLNKLKTCTKCHFDAPAAMLVCYHRTECWVRRYDGKPSGEVDASIVTTHLMLAAADLGVGSVWVMHFDPQAMREAFEIPEELEPVALLVLGYPAPDAAPNPRHTEYRDEKELVFYNKF